jgi:hypothetical protein
MSRVAEAVAIILRYPEKYVGLPVEWARMFMDRHNHEKSRLMRALTEVPRKQSTRAAVRRAIA